MRQKCPNCGAWCYAEERSFWDKAGQSHIDFVNRSTHYGEKIGIPVAISGIIGAIFGAKISVKMDVKHLKKHFGIFLILITIYEIYSLIKEYKKISKTNNKEKDKL